MRRLLSFILLAFVLAGPVSAQDTAADNGGKNRFSIKSYAFRGTYLDSSTHFEKFGSAAPAGINLGLEFPSQQQYPWQQYLNNATVGVGLSWIDLGIRCSDIPLPYIHISFSMPLIRISFR